ncbi:MAG: Coenzyme F420 hydrogenase/dehydrogenase, beta subunit C-terminal domain [Candidatus Rokubacteria bacterium]|nr:Coenzyme F420 hydrogenase/dehydrogenase, beta subunit C-terminal domain [Candidatus Rokubacteria bacterium]
MGKGPSDLQAEVLAADLCTGCGACLGHCPYLKTLGERVAFIHPCPRSEGRCYAVCPRTGLDADALDRQVFGAPRGDHVLGGHEALVWARALDPEIRARGQYGGVATALAAFALAMGTADAALLTRGGPGRMPAPVLARDRAGVLAAAGTKYTACPTLMPLAERLRASQERLVVVGRPCQVEAVRKIQARGDDGRLLVIGVFCFWALVPGFYRFLEQRGDLARAAKLDMPKEGGMTFRLNGRSTSVPIEEVRPFIRSACQVCFDPTAEWADVSVGSTEHDTAWNTVIVRTERGRAFVDTARDAGVLEIQPYPADRIAILREAVQRKKVRVLDAQAAGTRAAAYLGLSDAHRQAVRG